MAFEISADKKVLVVDDMATVRQAIVLSLRSLGMVTIQQAIDGEDGWEKIKACGTEEAFDIIFLDINMPKCNGIDLLKRIRSCSAFETIPVIMISTENEKDVILTAIQEGATNYILKPFTANIIKEKLALIK